MMSSPNAARAQIADLLAEAVELEHSLSLQYQFAAFGMKKHIDEGGVTYLQLVKMQAWEATLLSAARQEMEHLGLACNILSAIGEAPTLYRRNFPVPASQLPIEVGLRLLPFGLPMLRDAVLYELPSRLNPQHQKKLEHFLPDYRKYQDATIEKLYENIRALIKSAGDAIFVGSPDAQIGNIQVFPTQVIGVPIAAIATRAYYSVLIRPVYNAAQALAAIDQIRTEGEGWPAKRNYRGSHFEAFLQLYGDLSEELALDPGFEPSRKVVENPCAHSALPKRNGEAAQDGNAPTVLTNELANRVATLFDRGYQATVLMLMRFYFHQGQNQREIETLARIAFFPMMTSFIRPMGELLTKLCAFSDPERIAWRAGPGFAFAPRLAVIPDAATAWKVIRDEMQALREGVEALANSAAPDFDPADKARLALIWQNLSRMTLYFTQLVDPPRLPIPPAAGPTPPPALSKPIPRLVLQYGGWVLIRLPTDPDPTDEPRGVSGNSFAFGNEPDLTREIAFNVPAGYAPRSHTPEIGVFVHSAERLDDTGAHPIAALQGARFELLDQPKLENRNWTLTLPGCEPIVPFRMRVTGNAGVVLEALDILAPGLNPGDPPRPLWEATAGELARRGPPGFALEPATAASITGQWDSQRVTYDRYIALQKELEDFDRARGDPGALAVLLGRLGQLKASLEDPSDRRIGLRSIIERWGFQFNQAPSVSGDESSLGGPLVTSPNAWSIAFWIGGWDPDLLVAYMHGSLNIPYSK